MNMPTIRLLKQRDRKQKELYLVYVPWKHADDEKINKKNMFLRKTEEYEYWCKQEGVEPEYDEEIKKALDELRA